MNRLVLVRGAGDLATGVLLKLYHSGFAVAAAECARPSAIRRGAALSEDLLLAEPYKLTSGC